MSHPGYLQVIDNLVFHAIAKLQKGPIDDSWQQLVDVVNICAETYNVDPKDVLTDYSAKLNLTLTNLCNV